MKQGRKPKKKSEKFVRIQSWVPPYLRDFLKKFAKKNKVKESKIAREVWHEWYSRVFEE